LGPEGEWSGGLVRGFSGLLKVPWSLGYTFFNFLS
jgi:hypothetical protein